MVSRKRRWEDSDSDDQEEVTPDPRPAKRLFNSSLGKALRRPLLWMARQLSSFWSSMDETSPDPRTVTVGMALPAPATASAAGGAAADGANAPNGDRVAASTSGGDTAAAGATRPHTVDPESPLTGDILPHRRHGHLLSASATAMSSPNGSAAPPFHFSPSPVGRGAAFSALLLTSSAATGVNAPRRPAAHSISSVTSYPVSSSPTGERPPTPATAGPGRRAMASDSSSSSSSPVAVANGVGGGAASLASAGASVRPVQVAASAGGVRKPRYRSSSLSNDAVRLKERDRYRRLLNHFTSPPARHKGYGSTGVFNPADADAIGPAPLFARSGSFGHAAPHPSRPGVDQVYVNDGSGDEQARDNNDDDADSDIVITSQVAGNRAGMRRQQAQEYAHIISSPYGFQPADPRIAVASPSPRRYGAPQSAPYRQQQQRGAVHALPFRSPMLRQQQQQQQAGHSRYRPLGSASSQSPAGAGVTSPGLPTVASATDRRLASARYHEVAHRTPAQDVRLFPDDDDDNDTEESGSESTPSRGSRGARDSPVHALPGRGAHDSPVHALSPGAPRSWAKVSANSSIKKAVGTDWISNLCTEVNRTIKESQQRTDVLERHLQSLRLQREEKEYADSEKLKERLASVRQRSKDLRLVDAPLIDEPEEETLPELSDEHENMVTSALKSGSRSKVLSSAFNIDMTRGDVATLNGSGWLNDEVINFFFQMIKARNDASEDLPTVHVMSSFFYPKLVDTGYATIKRWTRKVDIFSKDLVAIPIHLGMHWCLAMIDFREKSIVYYDSLLGSNMQCLAVLRNYLRDESKDKKKVEFETSDWTFDQAKDIPEQLNGCDCGVFACTYAAYLTRDKPFSFSQDDMPYFRRRMVYEILSKQLMV